MSADTDTLTPEAALDQLRLMAQGGLYISQRQALQVAIDTLEREIARAQLPEKRDVGRIGDMCMVASLRVGLDADNDLYVAVADKDGVASIEFCTQGLGGGSSPHTRDALIALMHAIAKDNADMPRKDWWARRNSKIVDG